MTYSDIAREYLLNEGLPASQIIKTGSPMFEVLKYYLKEIESSDVLRRLHLKKHNYYVVSAHREENIESNDNFNKLVKIINALATKNDKRVIVSTHPRTRNRIKRDKISFDNRVELLKPLGFHDYVNLQMHALAVISDSGTINEESSILNFPALNLREAHERPEGMEEAAVIMTGLNIERVFQCLRVIESQPRGSDRLIREVSDYSMPNVSDKVLRIILSYTNYVNQFVWHKRNE